MGRVSGQSIPYLSDGTTDYFPPEGTEPSTQYEYDPLGRPTLVRNPDNTAVSRMFDHWYVTETDENGQDKTYQFDYRTCQRLLKVVEYNAGSAYTTHYNYKSTGELARVTDHLGNITNIQYDSLGRKTSMGDPDLGAWIYGYDRVGNLISQTDARGSPRRFSTIRLTERGWLTIRVIPMSRLYMMPGRSAPCLRFLMPRERFCSNTTSGCEKSGKQKRLTAWLGPRTGPTMQWTASRVRHILTAR